MLNCSHYTKASLQIIQILRLLSLHTGEMLQPCNIMTMLSNILFAVSKASELISNTTLILWYREGIIQTLLSFISAKPFYSDSQPESFQKTLRIGVHQNFPQFFKIQNSPPPPQSWRNNKRAKIMSHTSFPMCFGPKIKCNSIKQSILFYDQNMGLKNLSK